MLSAQPLHPEVLRVPLVVKRPGVRPWTNDALVSHMDLAPTLLSTVGVQPLARLDGAHLDALPDQRGLLHECGWHVGVNFACATVHKGLMYTYNLSSDADELFDLGHPDAPNISSDPRRRECIAKLGSILSGDPRWLGYWHSFRIDRYTELPVFDDADPQIQSGRTPH